jgi:hypothetical protein
MIFLYIAASVCMALCAGCAVIGIYALRRFRKWRGSVLARFTDLDAMIAAMPSVLLDDSKSRLSPAMTFRSIEEAVCAMYGAIDGISQRSVEMTPKKIREIVKQELKNALEDADASREERNAKDKKNGMDITDAVMSLWQYSMKDAFDAARGNREDGGE